MVLSLNAACASSAMVPLCNHSKVTVVHEEGILQIRHPPPPYGAMAAGGGSKRWVKAKLNPPLLHI
jgi:hypothetical protein